MKLEEVVKCIFFEDFIFIFLNKRIILENKNEFKDLVVRFIDFIVLIGRG